MSLFSRSLSAQAYYNDDCDFNWMELQLSVPLYLWDSITADLALQATRSSATWRTTVTERISAIPPEFSLRAPLPSTTSSTTPRNTAAMDFTSPGKLRIKQRGRPASCAARAHTTHTHTHSQSVTERFVFLTCGAGLRYSRVPSVAAITTTSSSAMTPPSPVYLSVCVCVPVSDQFPQARMHSRATSASATSSSATSPIIPTSGSG